jgi:Zn-dependent protease/CBS domain-containing protein
MNGEAGELRKIRGVSFFKVAGIRISFDYSWFIVFAVVLFALSEGYFPRYYPGHGAQAYWLAGLIATLFFFASVVVHEVAHSLMAIRSGIEITEITLFIFGGVSRITEEPRDPATELRIALVGPLSSFALAFGFWVVRSLFASFNLPMTTGIFTYLAWINLALGIFNLIPGFPLDGGRVFRALYWWRTGSLTQATRLAADIGKGFATALMVLGGLQIFLGDLIGGLWFIFIGMFLRGLSQRGFEEVVIRQSLEGVPVREVMVRSVVSVPPELPVSSLVQDYFLHYAYGGFPVIQDGRVVGLVSVAGVRGMPPEEQSRRQVAEIMTPLSGSLIISDEVSLAEALRRMTQEEQDRLLVMRGEELQGLITKSGLMRFVQLKQVLEPLGE